MKTSGTVIPSSRFLASKMLGKIDFTKANVIVELGPGNGAITKRILKEMHPKAQLICFEINQHFFKQLKKIEHPQLTVLNVSAEKVVEELRKLGYDKTCHIISSLPLTNMPSPITKCILDESYRSLEKNGTFTQYQYSLSYFKKLKEVFQEDITLDFEVFNIPPAFIYRCKKYRE